MALPAGPAPKTTLPRESSIYTLTLDEFQNTLGEPGKSFGSMNMDEFLKNIWTAEESQAMAAAMGSMAAIDRQQSLSRQGSFTLPRTITKKTVDEVWREIHKDTDTAMDCSMMGEATRQATFGEITLEDFLVKAGVAREDIDPGGLQAQQGFAPFGSCLDVGFEDTRGSAACTVAEEKASASALPTLSLSPATASNAFTGQLAAAMDPATFKHAIPSHFRSPNTPQPVTPHSSAQQQQQGTDVAAMYANSAKPIGNGALPGSVIGSPEAMNGGPPPGRPFGPCFGVGFGTGFALAYDAIGPNDVSSLSPVPFGMHAHFRGRKRGFEGPLEKIVERRQRRMIKNRESASRSRARKQAYTVELEAEVTQLKQENMLLRRQQEEAVQKKMQVFDMMAPLAQHLSSNIRVLRRSCTVPW